MATRPCNGSRRDSTTVAWELTYCIHTEHSGLDPEDRPTLESEGQRSSCPIAQLPNCLRPQRAPYLVRKEDNAGRPGLGAAKTAAIAQPRCRRHRLDAQAATPISGCTCHPEVRQTIGLALILTDLVQSLRSTLSGAMIR